MSFNAYSFLFDGQSSENYGLVISSINEGGVVDSPLGSGISLITKKLLRNPTEFLYGTEQQPVLEFDLEFFAEEVMPAEMRNIIASWLFGQQVFKKLRILQSDLQDVYFNVIFTQVSAIYVGRLHRGWKAHARCDSPFAYGSTITVLRQYYAPANEVYTYNNLSANAYYTYPVLGFRMSSFGGTLSVTNANDSNRVFSFTGLSANEVINMDCQRQILTSDTGLLRISNFNKKWFRFVPGINALTIVGNIDYITLLIPVVKKVGA